MSSDSEVNLENLDQQDSLPLCHNHPDAQNTLIEPAMNGDPEAETELRKRRETEKLKRLGVLPFTPEDDEQRFKGLMALGPEFLAERLQRDQAARFKLRRDFPDLEQPRAEDHPQYPRLLRLDRRIELGKSALRRIHSEKSPAPAEHTDQTEQAISLKRFKQAVLDNTGTTICDRDVIAVARTDEKTLREWKKSTYPLGSAPDQKIRGALAKKPSEFISNQRFIARQEKKVQNLKNRHLGS